MNNVTIAGLHVARDLPSNKWALFWLDKNLIGCGAEGSISRKQFDTILAAADYGLSRYDEWPVLLNGTGTQSIAANMVVVMGSWAAVQKGLRDMAVKADHLPALSQADRQRLVEIAEDIEEAARQFRLRIAEIPTKDA